MIFGDIQEFAIEIDIDQVIDEWVFGVFLFWIGGFSVGNKEDSSVDLKGCVGWLDDLLSKPRNRFEPGLFVKSREEVWKLLVDSVMLFGREKEEEKKDEIYADTFGRFHISHIGMSAFDRYTMVLICNEEGKKRLLWQCDDEEIRDQFLDVGTVESVSADVIDWFRRA